MAGLEMKRKTLIFVKAAGYRWRGEIRTRDFSYVTENTNVVMKVEFLTAVN
jgi:hypothetical protein